MTHLTTIPPGYMEDTRGRLVPESMVMPIDKLRDQTVATIAKQAEDLSAILAKFKASAFSDISAFISASAAQYGVDIGGEKGNVVLHTHDGRYKVVRSVAPLIRFDEQLIAAKQLVDDYLSELIDGSADELRVLVNEAFQVNATGAVRTSEIMRLLRYGIKDPRWLKAMDAIRNSIQVMGTKPYVRIYKRIGKTDAYEAIVLDIAKL